MSSSPICTQLDQARSSAVSKHLPQPFAKVGLSLTQLSSAAATEFRIFDRMNFSASRLTDD
jgi:hypothetical protein